MINSISFKGITKPEVNNEQIITTPQFRSNSSTSLEKAPAEDRFEKNDNTVKKAAIGTVVALGLAAAADGIFNHGKYLKKIFGQAEKTAIEAKPEPKPEPKAEPKAVTKNKDYENWLKEQEEAKKAVEESNTKNAEWVEEQHKIKEEEYSNWWNKELNAKEEAHIQAEKAAKEAKEKLQAEFTTEMDKIAQDKANEVINRWNACIDLSSRIYHGGFEKLSKGKTVFTLEDGSKKIVTKGKKQTISYYSKNGVNIDKMEYRNASGKLSHEVHFDRDHSGELCIFNPEGKMTEVIRFDSEFDKENFNRLIQWTRTYTPLDLKPEELSKIYNENKTQVQLCNIYFDNYAKEIEWHAPYPPKEINDFGMSNWTKL